MAHPDETKRDIISYYSREAPIYDSTHGATSRATTYNIERYYRVLFDRYLPRGGRFLEIGAGTGRYSRIFEAFSDDLFVSDISVEMLRHNPEAERRQVCADTEALPFPDAFFDCCVGVNTFSYLPHKRTGLEELMRVLKPGGRLFILDQNRRSFIYLISRLWYLRRRRLTRPTAVSESNLPFLGDLCEQVGFVVEASGMRSWIPHALPDPATRLLIPLDMVLSRLPGVRNSAMRLFLAARKP